MVCSAGMMTGDDRLVLFLFPITAAGVVPCGGRKKYLRISSVVQRVFSCWSFEISEGILRIQKSIIGLVSFSNLRLNIFGPIWILLVFVSTTLLKMQNYSHLLWLHVAKSIGSLKRLK